jgi:hypothetical protein
MGASVRSKGASMHMVVWQPAGSMRGRGSMGRAGRVRRVGLWGRTHPQRRPCRPGPAGPRVGSQDLGGTSGVAGEAQMWLALAYQVCKPGTRQGGRRPQPRGGGGEPEQPPPTRRQRSPLPSPGQLACCARGQGTALARPHHAPPGLPASWQHAATAVQAVGREEECIDLYKSIEANHPIKKVSAPPQPPCATPGLGCPDQQPRRPAGRPVAATPAAAQTSQRLQAWPPSLPRPCAPRPTLPPLPLASPTDPKPGSILEIHLGSPPAGDQPGRARHHPPPGVRELAAPRVRAPARGKGGGVGGDRRGVG